MGDRLEVIAALGTAAIFLAALLSLIYCVAAVITLKRLTMRLLLLALTATAVVVAIASTARKAAHENSVELIEWEREFYQDHQKDFPPAEYQRLIGELDKRAAALGDN